MLHGIFTMARAAAAMSVIAMLLEFLMPEGVFQKSIRMIIGLVFLLEIIRPIADLLGIAF